MDSAVRRGIGRIMKMHCRRIVLRCSSSINDSRRFHDEELTKEQERGLLEQKLKQMNQEQSQKQ